MDEEITLELVPATPVIEPADQEETIIVEETPVIEDGEIILSDEDNTKDNDAHILNANDLINLAPQEDNNEEEVILDEPLLVKDRIPGAPHAQPFKLDDNSAKDTEEDKPKEERKPKDDWDWAFHGLDNFITWANDRYQKIPKHSGRDLAGLERAFAYLEKLYAEVRKAMRQDYDGKLDSDKIEKICVELENGMSALENEISNIEKSKKNKKASDEQSLVKTAASINTSTGIVISVSPTLMRCAQVCIGGAISAGHDIKQIFNYLTKKNKLDDREQSDLLWLLNEMGYPVDIIDRGLYVTETIDFTSEDNPELSQQHAGG